MATSRKQHLSPALALKAPGAPQSPHCAVVKGCSFLCLPARGHLCSGQAAPSTCSWGTAGRRVRSHPTVPHRKHARDPIRSGAAVPLRTSLIGLMRGMEEPKTCNNELGCYTITRGCMEEWLQACSSWECVTRQVESPGGPTTSPRSPVRSCLHDG